MWQGLIVLLGLIFTNAAAASGTIGYGSRAGMEVSVISVEGLNTSRAVIRTKHTRENAVAFCRDYVGKVTEQCIRQELSVPLNDSITANCVTGEFSRPATYPTEATRQAAISPGSHDFPC
jgi:hypothetical protein